MFLRVLDSWRAVVVLVAACFTSSVSAQTNEFRGIWVDAWGSGFLNSSQVTTLIDDCRTYNFNAIVVQMRRRGDAFYTPGFAGNDPKTTAIASNFDALQDIINKAHSGSPRIEVHCWVTTQVIWSSLTPPSQAGHVVNLHPEYLTRNFSGDDYLAEGFYLDPGHPDATLWNYVMATNIVQRYDVDGFHWDYIRYPQQDSGYNPMAIARYNAEFGLTGQPSPSSSQFSDWRRRQVTDFLRWVNSDLLAVKPNLVISCAVFGNRTDAYANRFQDWAAWNSEGAIDICMPMGYTSNNSLFTSRVTDAFNNQGVRRVYSGQGAYLNTKENTVYQLDSIRNQPLSGSVLYSYRSPNSAPVTQTTTLAYIRDNHQPTWLDVPAIPWKANPTKGIVRGTVTREGEGTAVYNANLSISTVPARNQLTEPHGKFAFLEVAPGSYNITASAGELASVVTNITIAAGQNIDVNIALPPDDTPPVISDVTVTGVSDTAATVTWTTDEDSDSAVDYGPTTLYGSAASNATLTIDHAIPLTGLAPDTPYHFRVRSRNATGLTNSLGDFMFSTNPSGVVDDLVVDDEDATVVGAWTQSSFSPGYHNIGYRYRGQGTGANHVEFRPNVLTPGNYQVSVWYVASAPGGNRTTNAPHVIGYDGGTATIGVNQETNGSHWFPLGIFPFAAGTNGYVRVTDEIPESSGNLTIADGIKFTYMPPPIITAQPADRTVMEGGNAVFTVSATGSLPLNYQWRFNASDLPGATGVSHSLVGAQANDAGLYSVVVTNLGGSVTSSVATLTVNPWLPVRFESVVRLPDGTIQFLVSGTSNETVWIDRSTHLPPNWQAWTNGFNASGAVIFIDHSSTGSPQSFYRARQ